MRKRLFLLCILGLTLFGAAYLASMSVDIPKPIVTASPSSYSSPASNENGFDKRKHCIENIHCKTLAESVFFEARGEPTKAQVMVASVIINRRDALRWPDDVYSVVHQKRKGVCQFSYVCQLSKTEQHNRIAKEPKAWKKAVDVAYKVYHYEIYDVTEADHFYNPKRVKRKPKFAYVYERVAMVGSHIFYASN